MRWAVGELRGTLMEVLGQDSGIPDTNLDLYISQKGNIKEMEWVLLMEYVWMTLFPALVGILAPQFFFFLLFNNDWIISL